MAQAQLDPEPVPAGRYDVTKVLAGTGYSENDPDAG